MTAPPLTKEQAQILVTWLDVRHQLALTIEEAAGEFPEQGFIDALRSLIAIAEQ